MNQSNANTLLKLEKLFKVKNNKKYEVEAISNNIIYGKKIES